MFKRFLELFMLSSAALSLIARPAVAFTAGHHRSFLRTTTLAMSSKKVLVPISDGSEEIETTCIQDTLTRFGAEVTVASVKPDGELLCKMSRGIQIQAHTTIAEAAKEEWDLIALPGGMPGAAHLRDSEPLILLLEKQKASGRLYGAVCAAPAVVLASKGLIAAGAAVTCFPAPALREQITTVSDDRVVVTDNLTTSQGPGTSIEFALQLGEHLFGKEKRDEIAEQMLFK
jgi:4-methyl-5(b-hydroxyethyl)-thiazole monophosphate biosynthesis